MNDAPPPPRLRGAPLVLARAAALVVSIGVLGLLMMRAGTGCRSNDTAAVAEQRPAGSTPEPSAAPSPVQAAPATSSSGKPRFFPGSKAGSKLLEPAAEPMVPFPTPAASARPAAPADPKPHFFPGSKAMGGDIVDPVPMGETPKPPAQPAPPAKPGVEQR